MKKLAIALILLFSLSLDSCAGARNADSLYDRVDPSLNNIEEEILVLINNYRKSRKLPPLKLNNVIGKEARNHSLNMAESKVPFSHNGFNDRVKTINEKLYKIQSAAENVAEGQRTAEEVVQAWIRSPHHKENIEGNFTETGIGVAADKKGVLYYTQIFVR
jgi:uncharacterized protein YkwD